MGAKMRPITQECAQAMLNNNARLHKGPSRILGVLLIASLVGGCAGSKKGDAADAEDPQTTESIVYNLSLIHI